MKSFPGIVPIALLATMMLATETLVAQGIDTSRNFEFNPVVITALQADVLRNSLPNSITVLSRQEMEQCGSTALLSVLNREVPGLFVTERGVLGFGVANGAAGGITMRGSGGSPTTGVLVLTDNRPQMMGLMGHPLPDAYSTSGVERVEIIRGPASLQYGSNAMGGVINIIPLRDYERGLHVQTGTTAGSCGTWKLDFEGDAGFNRGGVQVTAAREQTDGHREWSSFRLNGGGVRARYALTDVLTLVPDLSITDFRTYDPGPASSPARDNWVDATRGSAGIALEDATEHMDGALKVFANWGRHDIYDGFHSTDQFVGGMLYQAFHLGTSSMLTTGVSVQHYGGAAENRITHFDYGDHRITESAVYIVAKQDSLGPISVTGGVRYNYHTLSKGEVIPQIGLSALVARGTVVRASVGKGFRSPTIRELYLFPAPTPTLIPERMWNYEIGIRGTFGDWASLEAAGFLAEGRNMILVAGAYPHLVLSNSGRFTHRGVEVSTDVVPAKNVFVKVSYGFIDPAAQTNANPKHKGDIDAVWSAGDATVNLGLQWVSGLYGADNFRKPLSEYTILRARVAYRLAYALEVSIAGENLLNRQYQIIDDYPMPGRTIFLGLKLTD